MISDPTLDPVESLESRISASSSGTGELGVPGVLAINAMTDVEFHIEAGEIQ